MAPLPDDDVPTTTGTPDDRPVEVPDGGDDTTTADAGPPASHLRHHNDADAEDRTVQSLASAPRRPPPMPSSRPPPPGVVPTAIVASTSGLSTTASAGDAVEEIDVELQEDDEEELDDSITTMAPPVSRSLAGIVIPGSVEIRSVEHDELLDETEVRTRPGNVPFEIPLALRASSTGRPLPPPRPAAGVPASGPVPSTEPEPDDDGVTTEAPAPHVGSAPELAASIGISPAGGAPVGLAPITLSDSVEEPLTRPGVESTADPPTRPAVESAGDPPTRPGVEPASDSSTRPGIGDALASPRKLPRLDGYANDQDGEDSVTTQGPAISESSIAIAAAGPKGPKNIRDATMLDDGTDGTTQKLRKLRRVADSAPADGEAESITTEAPGPLTNILRVIAAEPGTLEEDVARIEDDEPSANRTEVMANAPLNRIIAELVGAASASGSGALPAIRPTGPPLTMPHGSSGARAAAARQLIPTSESGLRLARGSGESASVGGADERASGIARTASPSGPHDPRPFASTEAAFPAQPSAHGDLDKGPRYGLVVGIVAFISFVIPVTLFVVLRARSEVLTPGVPAEAATELQEHDATVRGKLDKKAAAASASASASASGSSSAHKPPTRPPFRR